MELVGDEKPSLLYKRSPPRETTWTFEENKLFENCLGELDLGSDDLFEKISSIIVGKTIIEIKEHYKTLLEDVKNIESGLVPIPKYTPLENDVKKRRYMPWTIKEHEEFLAGLERYGKGDWKNISRHCVKTKNPTQVASHAQKYFIRLNKQTKGGI